MSCKGAGVRLVFPLLPLHGTLPHGLWDDDVIRTRDAIIYCTLLVSSSVLTLVLVFCGCSQVEHVRCLVFLSIFSADGSIDSCVDKCFVSERQSIPIRYRPKNPIFRYLRDRSQVE